MQRNRAPLDRRAASITDQAMREHEGANEYLQWLKTYRQVEQELTWQHMTNIIHTRRHQRWPT